MKNLKNILFLLIASFLINEVSAQVCNGGFVGGPFTNYQDALPCDATCGTPLTGAFDVWQNESYLLGSLLSGSEYTFTVGTGLAACGAGFVGTVELSVYEWDGVAITGPAIGFDSDVCASGGLTVTIPADADYILIVSDTGDCAADTQTDSGLLSLDCGPSGAVCPGGAFPPPALAVEGAFCNDGTGVPFSVLSCDGMIAVEDGGNDIIYVLSVYYDAASATPYTAPPGTTAIDPFDPADNYLLMESLLSDGTLGVPFLDCNGTLNPIPTLITTTNSVIGDLVIDLTTIASVCQSTVVSLFAIPLDRATLTPAANVLELPVTLYPTGITANVTDDGSSCGTPTVELVAADGTVCETLAGTGCTTNGDSFTTDFASSTTGVALTGAPVGCELPADVTVTCAGCDSSPCDLIITIEQTSCDDAGTSDDASDDIIEYTVTVSGGTGTWSDAGIGVSGQAYDMPTAPIMVTGAGSVTVTAIDDADATCTATLTDTLPGCAMPAIPTLSQWGLMTLALMLMVFGAIKISAPTIQTASRKK